MPFSSYETYCRVLDEAIDTVPSKSKHKGQQQKEKSNGRNKRGRQMEEESTMER
jgi:hypothetical protein